MVFPNFAHPVRRRGRGPMRFLSMAINFVLFVLVVKKVLDKFFRR